MLVYFLPLLTLLLIIFFLAKAFINNLYFLFFLIFRSKFWAIQLTTLILLPGTIIHELSHLIIAEVLRVPTGKINFYPQIKEAEVRVGSLQIAQVDPFRRTLVGLAPLFTGLTILTLISKFYFIKTLYSSSIIHHPSSWYLLLAACYLTFAISNTMFSSKKDLEAAILPAIILFMIFGAFYLGGFSIQIKPQTQEIIRNILIGINLSLGLIIVIDLSFLIIVKILFSLSQKIFKQKLIATE